MRVRSQRILASMIGFVLFAVSLEIGLRLAGSSVYPRPHLGNGHENGDGFRILCIGDSYTAGQGIAEYPSALEEDLRQRGHDVTVLNGGIGGANSAMVREALPGLITDAQPDLAILLAGITNSGSYYGFSSFARADDPVTRLDDALFHVRVWRLARYVATALKQRPRTEPFPPDLVPRMNDTDYVEGQALASKGDLDGSLVFFRRYVHQHPTDSAGYWNVAVIVERLSPTAARRWYEACLEADLDDARCSSRLALYAQVIPALGRRERDVVREGDTNMLEMVMACVRQAPEFDVCYSHLALAARSPEDRARVVPFLEEMSADSSVAEDYLEMWRSGRDPSVNIAWARRDLEWMVDYVQSMRIPILLMDYPMDAPVNGTLREVADEKGVEFVSMNAEVSQVFAAGSNGATLLRPDLHCTEEGYRLMARILGQRLDEGGWVE